MRSFSQACPKKIFKKKWHWYFPILLRIKPVHSIVNIKARLFKPRDVELQTASNLSQSRIDSACTLVLPFFQNRSGNRNRPGQWYNGCKAALSEFHPAWKAWFNDTSKLTNRFNTFSPQLKVHITQNYIARLQVIIYSPNSENKESPKNTITQLAFYWFSIPCLIGLSKIAGLATSRKTVTESMTWATLCSLSLAENKDFAASECHVTGEIKVEHFDSMDTLQWLVYYVPKRRTHVEAMSIAKSTRKIISTDPSRAFQPTRMLRTSLDSCVYIAKSEQYLGEIGKPGPGLGPTAHRSGGFWLTIPKPSYVDILEISSISNSILW